MSPEFLYITTMDVFRNGNDIERKKMFPIGGRSVIVWSLICLNGSTELIVIANSTLTALLYRSDILEPQVLPVVINVGSGFILQHGECQTPQSSNVVIIFE